VSKGAAESRYMAMVWDVLPAEKPRPSLTDPFQPVGILMLSGS